MAVQPCYTNKQSSKHHAATRTLKASNGERYKPHRSPVYGTQNFPKRLDDSLD
uniref:Uncharacterized protein n=1 Tax=Arundo donax TaxID=35708 RepID=A0A0A9DHL7_ARUDO